MLELNVCPKDINGVAPYMYEFWYRSDKKVLKWLEYERRPGKILENISYSPGMKVLDIGCDWGYLLMYIKKVFKDVECYGVDLHEDIIEFGNELARQNEYSINLRYANGASIPFDDNSFDVVVTTETFEHIIPDQRVQCLKECFRVLKTGGQLLMTTPNKFGIAEIAKVYLGKFAFFRKLCPMLTNKTGVLHTTNKGDSLTDIAESIPQLANMVKIGGFNIQEHMGFIFVPEITPNKLINLAAAFENILERIKVLNFIATTQYINAIKP
jgi:ubiquinone/menaquinone biosynthesis C-methylase UbiE